MSLRRDSAATMSLLACGTVAVLEYTAPEAWVTPALACFKPAATFFSVRACCASSDSRLALAAPTSAVTSASLAFCTSSSSSISTVPASTSWLSATSTLATRPPIRGETL